MSWCTQTIIKNQITASKFSSCEPTNMFDFLTPIFTVFRLSLNYSRNPIYSAHVIYWYLIYTQKCLHTSGLSVWLAIKMKHETAGTSLIGSPWWRHQMKTFSALMALCVGNSPLTREFPSQRSVTRSFDFFFDLRLNKQLSKQSWGWWFETLSRSLWRYCNDQARYLLPNSPIIICY